MTLRAAGVLITTGPNGRALFLKRADTGLWAFPGGGIEGDETPEAAAEREIREEIGSAPYGSLRPWIRRVKDDGDGEVDFTTLVAPTSKEFVPELNDEHTAWTWASPTDPPQPLHPGAAVAVARFGMDELGVARAMAAGDLVSPQQYGTFLLWKIRITGTGLAWRGAEKDAAGKILREEEFCWRDRSLYLTPDFLARCAGLPVTFIHSDGKTDSKEWEQRAVGTVFLPFIENEEVWSIAKVYDDAANTILSKGFSTSPSVFFGAAGAGAKVQLEDGTKLLIEGKPALLDSIALVPAGVWDKGSKPHGVDSTGVVMADETEAEKKARGEREDRARKDAEMHAKLDAIVGKLDSAHSRLDAMESGEKERQDAARKDAARGARMDAHRKDRFGARKDGEGFKDWKARHDADEAAMCDAMRKDGGEEADAREDAASARRDAEERERKDGGESFEKWAKEEGREPEHKDARKDAEEKAVREREDAKRHDATTTELAEVRRQLAAMNARFVPVSAEERNGLALAQSRADGIAGLFGKRASGPTPGETSLEYRRRLAAEFKEHSPRFKDKRLDSLDADVFGPIEEIIYADAASAARSPDRAGAAGILIPIREPDETGRVITRWTGDPMAWMQHFMTGGQSGKILDPRQRA